MRNRYGEVVRCSQILETLCTPSFRIETPGTAPWVGRLWPTGQVWTDPVYVRQVDSVDGEGVCSIGEHLQSDDRDIYVGVVGTYFILF